MTIHISLLRGINVGGNKKVPMKALVEVYESNDCQSVTTYIQSGNVVFMSDENSESLQEKLSAAIAERFGFTVDLMQRTLEEWREIIAVNPFPSDNPKLLHVFLLNMLPEKANLDAFLALERNGEEIALIGTSIYFYTPNGFGTSKLANVMERKLKVSMTARNWNTMLKILEIAEGKA